MTIYDFQGKVALVTGGASGMGRSCALEFARGGARVAVTDVNVAAGLKVAEDIAATGGVASFFTMDVGDSGSINEAFASVEQTFGRLHYAVNCAGVMGGHNVCHEYSPEEWARVVNINLTGVFLCMQAELRLMLQEGGSIVNIASVAGVRGVPGMPAYIASKHGVVGLTRSAAMDYATRNIRINAICPGMIDTPMLTEMFGVAGDRYQGKIPGPMKRLGKTEEISATALWLCSDGAGFVNGQAIAVDGGVTAGPGA